MMIPVYGMVKSISPISHPPIQIYTGSPILVLFIQALNFTPSDSDKKYENAGDVRGHPPIQQIHTLQLSRTPNSALLFLLIILVRGIVLGCYANL